MAGYARGLLAIILWSALVLDVNANFYITRYMMSSSNYCNSGTTSVSYDNAGYVDLKSSSAPYADRLNCVLTLDAGSGKRIYVQFNTIDIDSGDRLSMYDGPSTASAILGHVSGSYTSFKARTNSRYLTLKFTSYNNYFHTGFSMIYTIFETSCDDDDFTYECDNDYCVSDTLTCDFIDNCGDDSDEGDDADCYYAWGVGLIIGVVVASLVGATLVIAACVCCCVCATAGARQRRQYQHTVIHSGPAPYPAVSGSYGGYGATSPGPGYPPHYQQGAPPGYDNKLMAGAPPQPAPAGAQPPPYQQYK